MHFSNQIKQPRTRTTTRTRRIGKMKADSDLQSIGR
jgi:hypothetical protein